MKKILIVIALIILSLTFMISLSTILFQLANFFVYEMTAQRSIIDYVTSYFMALFLYFYFMTKYLNWLNAYSKTLWYK